MRALKSPVTQFLLVGLLTVVGLVLATGYLADRAANSEAVTEAQQSIGAVASALAPNGIRDRLLVGRAGDIDRFTRKIDPLIANSDVEHIVIWSPHGRVVYSDETRIIGERPGLGRDQLRVVQQGGTGSDWSGANDADATEVIAPGSGRQLLQTYTKIETVGGRPLLFEGYFSVNQVDTRRQAIFSSFRWLVIGPLLLLIALVTAMLRVLTSRLTRAGRERERLLIQAIDASDAERRRIARDLHDGVVQDLAGTAFSVSAVARDPSTPPETQATLRDAARSLRDGLKDLRSLLAEIHPPEPARRGPVRRTGRPHRAGRGAGIQASVSVEGAEEASDGRAALVWRVAQEAVRNALRHSAPRPSRSPSAAPATGSSSRWSTTASASRPGGQGPRAASGCAGCAAWSQRPAARSTCDSSPGEGTTVRMEVAAR